MSNSSYSNDCTSFALRPFGFHTFGLYFYSFYISTILSYFFNVSVSFTLGTHFFGTYASVLPDLQAAPPLLAVVPPPSPPRAGKLLPPPPPPNFGSSLSPKLLPPLPP